MTSRLALAGLVLSLAAASAVWVVGDVGGGLPADRSMPSAVPEAARHATPSFTVPQLERGSAAFVERFDQAETGGHRQSWDVVQAPTGLIYVANSDGVLEYDGANWRLIDVPNFYVRALAVGPDGRVYVGGAATAGVLVPDSSQTGKLTYQEILGEEDLSGEPVWAAFSTEQGVVFQTFGRIVEVRDGVAYRFQEAPEGQRYHKAFSTADEIYVRLEGVGLLRYGDEGLRAVPDGAAFRDWPVRALFDLDGAPGGELLAVTDDRLYRLGSGSGLVEVESVASGLLTQTRAYHGCTLGDPGGAQLFAIATLGNGVVIVNAAGQVVEHLWTGEGLGPDDLVLGCGVDVQGGLWLALSNGVARADALAPLSVFRAEAGLEGAVSGVARHDGHLYVATERGVFRMEPASGAQSARFVPVTSGGRSLDQAWMLMATPSGLLAPSTAGLYVIDGTEARLAWSGPAYAVTVAGDVAYVGLSDGLLRMERRGEWRPAGLVEGVEGFVGSVVRTEQGVWAAETDGKLFHVAPDGVAAAFDGSDGVPPRIASAITFEGDLIIISEDGPYRVRLNGKALEVSPALGLAQLVARVTDDLADGYALYHAGAGRVWAFGRERLRLLERTGDDWADITPPALRALTGIETAEVEGDVTWIGTSSGLYRLVAGGQERYEVPVPALLRSVTADGEPLAPGADVSYQSPVRFRFSAAAYNAPEATRFRSQLLGHDDRPSPWSDEHFRDYTNLPPGEYAFRVEARTVTETSVTPAVVRFEIPPPWYLTRWFTALAGLLGIAVVAAVAQGASLRQRRRADAERDRADELHRLNAELVRADKLKDHMLANTSHELRTPLTAILGFSEILTEYEGGDPAAVRHYAGHMLSGGRRLLRTVNDVLDIAQLRAGKVELRPRPLDAAALARDVVSELQPLAVEKNLGLAVFPKDLAVAATVDPDALARVVTNLVSNAIKFTERGAVSVTVDAEGGALVLTVRDTGRGIAAAFLPRLFDAFEQESTGHGRAAEGNGLGLSITRQLVELMGGTISVASEVGAGTVFRVALPADADVRALGPAPGTSPEARPVPAA